MGIMRAPYLAAVLSILVAASAARAEVRAPPGFAAMVPTRPDTACVARNVYHEARGEGATGMVAVGAVALNRVREQGVSACSVIYQKVGGRCQFAWACGRPTALKGHDWDRSMAVAEALMAPSGLPDPTKGATFFSACGFRPAQGLMQTARIGAHCFWRAATSKVVARPRVASFDLQQDPARLHGWSLTVAEKRDSFLEVADAPEQYATLAHRQRTRSR